MSTRNPTPDPAASTGQMPMQLRQAQIEIGANGIGHHRGAYFAGAEAGHLRISTEYAGLSEDVQDWLDRTLFRYHRRAISHRRGT